MAELLSTANLHILLQISGGRSSKPVFRDFTLVSAGGFVRIAESDTYIGRVFDRLDLCCGHVNISMDWLPLRQLPQSCIAFQADYFVTSDGSLVSDRSGLSAAG